MFTSLMKYGFKAGFNKPIIWIEAGIHAREWISPAVATFIFRELVEDYGSPQGKNCTGVDLNRNWDFHWGGKSVKCTKNFF